MSNLDVSLRLRLVNQLSRPAEEAERDLKDLKKAVDMLGRGGTGNALTGDLRKIGTEADKLRRTLGQVDNGFGSKIDGRSSQIRASLGGVETSATNLRRALGRADDTFGKKVSKRAQDLKSELNSSTAAVDELRRKLGTVDDNNPFAKLISSANRAETEVRQIGQAADNAQAKLRQIRVPGQQSVHPAYAGAFPGANDRRAPGRGGAVVVPPGVGPVRPTSLEKPKKNWRTSAREAVIAGYERSDADTIAPLGRGGAAMVGTAAAVGVAGTVLAYKKYASRDRQIGYIGEAAGADAEQTEAGRKQIYGIAKDAAATMDMAIEALAALQATGLSWSEMLERLPTVLKTAVATGASPGGLANTTFQVGDKMGITQENLQKALDYVVAGGDLGQFETSDMASYLPSVLPMAGIAGYEGIEGLRRVIAMLQKVRANTADSSSAAAYLTDLFFKYNSTETIGNFEDYGIDLRAGLAAGKKRGEDPVVTLRNLTDLATGGDESKLNTLFRDKQVYQAMVALAKSIEDGSLDTMEAEIAGSEGTVDRKHERFSNDAQANVDRLGIEIDRNTQAIGQLVHIMGGSGLLGYLTERLENVADNPGREALNRTILGQLLKLYEWGAGADRSPEANARADARRRQGMDDWLAGPMGRLPATPTPSPHPESLGRSTGRIPIPVPRPSNVPLPVPRPDGDRAMRQLERTLGKPMDDAARQAMDGYNASLQAEGEEAVGAVQGFVDRMKALLNFHASPTISPRFDAPAAQEGARGRKARRDARQSSSATPAGGSTTKITQNITSPHPVLAARRAKREEARATRVARNDALHDIGSLHA